MFEFMDGVVDAMEETGKVVVDGVVYCLICVAKLALIITAPVWALPYTIWRKGRNPHIFRQEQAGTPAATENMDDIDIALGGF